MTPERTKPDERRLQLGRELLARWMGLIKALRLYHWRHGAAQDAAERIREIVRQIGDGEFVDLSLRDDTFYVDRIRVPETGALSVIFHNMACLLRAAGVASFGFDASAPSEDVQLLAHLLLAAVEDRSTPRAMVEELRVRGASIEVTLMEDDAAPAPVLEGRELQHRIHIASISVLKSVFHEARTKDRINARRVKRVVQQMMESLETDAGYALNLTSVKNHDEYTFNHSANVSVLAIALGRTVGLSRRQLYVLGQAGMLHDLGKLCVPRDLLKKPGRLTPVERKLIQEHPGEGFLSIASRQGVTSETIGVALGAYEHHLNLDGTGYPEAAVKRPIGLLSRILAIVDRYDAMTSARVYRRQPISPPKALSILYHSQKSNVDQTLLHFFMNMLGLYPLGTVVRLSDSSVAIVVQSGSVSELPHLPCVRIILDEDGRPGSEEMVDLSAMAKDHDALMIIETLSAADFGIEVMDYIL